ncbi:hypothetical protein AB8A31_09845 [Tardiphaga sp. 804_B3_N1_9]|uniref:hypothetical protein n=1 Tax=Tardiphaga TaxID=1395974 RepID=UPI00158607D6|nr:hypothetical protein [Tardiphaga robiniae]NUU39888.1 hypothetical protein [Tardiphaga robiniae]
MGDKDDQNSRPDDTALKWEISVAELWWVAAGSALGTIMSITSYFLISTEEHLRNAEQLRANPNSTNPWLQEWESSRMFSLGFAAILFVGCVWSILAIGKAQRGDHAAKDDSGSG